MQLPVSRSPIRFGLLAFAAAITLNLIVYSQGRTESLIYTAMPYILMCLSTYCVSMIHAKSAHFFLLKTLVFATTLLALHSLLQLTFLYRLPNLPLFMQTRAFTPTGVPLTTFILLLISAITSLYLSIQHHKSKIFFIISSMLHIISLISLGYLLLPGQELAPTTLPLRASWNISLDALKSLKSLLIGIGLADFTSFYRSVKPLFLNSTSFWNLTPTTSGSGILHLLTTTGIIGLAAFLSIPLAALKQSSSDSESQALAIIASLSGLALVLTPLSLPVIFIFLTSLGLLSSNHPHYYSLSPKSTLLISAATLGLISYLGYQIYLVVASEVYMRQAQAALSNNDGKTVYEKNLAAIKLVPTLSRYHLSFSQVNLSLAGALSQKTSPSDEDKNNITRLISQSIQEAKTAISLRPQDAVNWQNLGSIYRNLVDIAKGSDQFAKDAYSQAVALDPANPSLRVEFGGLLYQLKEYDRAQNEFKTAISLKPDFASAYYNLAKVLETKEDYTGASAIMQKSISLLSQDSADLGRATAELETIKAKIAKP